MEAARKLEPSVSALPLRERRLCFVGPMVGRNPGLVTTQGEILTDHFAASGFSVLSVSSAANRYARLADIVQTIIRRRREIDVQVIQVYGGPSFVVEDIASRLGRLFGHPIVMYLRGGAMPEFMARYPRWTRRVLGRADVILTPSGFLAEAVRPYGFTAEVIPQVINLAGYEYRERRELAPRLFWLRSFHEMYNPHMAVRMMARLREEVPDATLVMAGSDKGMKEAVVEHARSLGLADAIEVVGFLDFAGKLREGARADIAISTNSVDNTPVSVLETCAMGLPVVSTSVGGVPYLLDHEKTGLLVPDDDEVAMVEAVKRLLREPELAARLSRNGRALAEQSAWDRVLPRWEAVLSRVFDPADHAGRR